MKKSIITLGSLALLVGSVAFAQTELGTVKTSLKQDLKTVTQEQKVIATCNVITNKIAGRVTNFNTNRNKHVENYIAAKGKIAELLTKLEAKGLDVSKVKTDLAQYDVLVRAFADSYSVYITDLTATQNYACGKSEGEFRAQLQVARTQLKAVREADQAVKDYWKETIKPDLQALRANIKTTKSAATTSTTTTDNSTTGTTGGVQ